MTLKEKRSLNISRYESDIDGECNPSSREEDCVPSVNDTEFGMRMKRMSNLRNSRSGQTVVWLFLLFVQHE